MDTDEVLIQAALLHDTVEWTDTSIDEIRQEFGTSVAELVEEVSSVKNGGSFTSTVKDMSREAKMIRIAEILDKLMNLAKKSGLLEVSEQKLINNYQLEVASYREEELNDKLLAYMKHLLIQLKDKGYIQN